MTLHEHITAFGEAYSAVRTEIGKVIVGHEAIVDGTMIALFAGGHVLLEGVPGLGKTLLVRTVGEVLKLSVSRIQFTPDLMPADIIGTHWVVESADGQRTFQFQRGPVFANLVLADEINRATPKTQSALLEAMQEKQVTAGGAVRRLDAPFFVLATQNPIDQEGTYPLPEAQLDRFFFKLLVDYPSGPELREVLDRTTGNAVPNLKSILDAEALRDFQRLVREVPVVSHMKDYAVRIVLATHPGKETAIPMANQFLRFGSSPRGAQALILAAKVRALAQHRTAVAAQDIQWAAPLALRHRLILNFEAEAEGVTPDLIIQRVLSEVAPDPVAATA